MPLPTLFVSHGAPNLVLDTSPARTFLETLAQRFDRPRAILIASAHFETSGVSVVADPAPDMIYDFRGFEEELYRMRYPAPGDPVLAGDIMELLSQAKLEPGRVEKRGYDHGAWSPLMLAYPEARIPVVQVSIDPERDAGWHLAVGRALTQLRGDNVLIVGSGHITHNLRAFFMRGRDAELDRNIGPWVDAFTNWFEQKLSAGDMEALVDWQSRAPFASENHPTPEHLMPLFFALGAAGASPEAQRVHTSRQMGFFAYDSYMFH